jgi:hypothetical protein
LEATTAQSFDPARDSLADMPNVRRLREQSFLMGSHYTSYPLTNAAAFSIFTSLYQKRASGEEVRRNVVIPGLISNLRGAGYDTGYYGYVWRIPAERDDLMLASFGFNRIVEPEIDPKRNEEGNSTFYGPVDFAESRDIQALQSLRSQIHSWTATNQKFIPAFFPEFGPDPYRELSGHHSKSQLERGHQLAVHQDAWLGELIDELVLHLLGISTGADLQQGSPIFSPGIENRRLFLAMNFFGASGYYDLGSYYSLGPLGACTRVEPSTFTDKGALRFNDKEAQNARAVLAEQDASRRVILSNVLHGEDH